ncbi:MAG: rod-binding protein [Clostridiales bacterium]|nr:rod-binding protein [Clostridiales bacterium]
MSIRVGSESSFYNAAAQSTSTSKTSKVESDLEAKLAGNLKNASDEELMDACKSFESYLVMQVMKQVKETVAKSEEEEGDYMNYFGDMLYEKYAEDITESGNLGIAQQLYEAMKRNQQ